MKKVYLILASVLIIAAGCKKDETKPIAGGYSVNGTSPSTEISVMHNLYVDQNESVASDMPKNAVIEAFHLTESQFNELWASGNITYSIKNSDQKADADNSFTINEKGEVVTTGGVFRIQQPKDNFWKMKVYGIKGYEALIGKTVSFTQVFTYTSGVKVKTTFSVPWKLKVVKGDPRITNEKTLSSDTQNLKKTFDMGTNEFVIEKICVDSIKAKLGSDTQVDSAYVYLNGAPVYKDKKFVRGNDMYFLADGTLTVKSDGDAALRVWYDEKEGQQWKCSYTNNENTEGASISVQIAFVHNEEFALLYPIKVTSVARQFMKVDSSWFIYDGTAKSGIYYNISVLKTSNSRVSKAFDLPSRAYDALKAMGYNSLAELVEKGFAVLKGGTLAQLATGALVESTILPYGHWFAAGSAVVASSSDLRVAGFEMTPNSGTGHCTFVLENGNTSALKVTDTQRFIQALYFPVKNMTLPIYYNVTYVSEIE